MKIAYFNCAAGVAGDMILASLIDAGLSPTALSNHLKRKMSIKDWKLVVTRTDRNHFPAHHLEVLGDIRFDSPVRMQRLIRDSRLSEGVRKNSLAILAALVAAEAKVHGVPPAKVHFHELNSLDTVVDIVGSCVALEMMAIEEVYASPVNIGTAAPATMEIIKSKSLPVYSSTSAVETATPTGIAIMAHLARGFGEMPLLRAMASGLGAGTKIIPRQPNLLQVIIGETEAGPGLRGVQEDEVVILETNIDDMDPRVYPYLMEKLLSRGAVDCWLTQVIMKKGRPGTVVSVICPPEKEGEIAGIVFRETTTLGIRRKTQSRHVLRRTVSPAKKTVVLPDGRIRTRTEYESSRKKAIRTGRSIRSIID